MDDNYRFDYFYGSRSEQFPFFRLPKEIVRGERFRNLSSDAKILYGILLDRLSLSRENHWVDGEDRVYIIFTLNEVMQEFDCCKRKAGMLMAELDTRSGVGLIEKKKQGLGKPDLIYLKNFTVCPSEAEEKTAENKGDVQPFQSGRNMQLKSGTDVPPRNSRKMQLKNGRNPPANHTEYNHTDSSKTDSIHPSHLATADTADFYRSLVKETINYADLQDSLSIIRRQMLEEIVELMAEVLSVNRKTLRIAGAEVPYAFVRERFLCLGQDHIAYVLTCLEQTSSRIGNIKAYLLTCLFNAPATIDTYYATAVNHDISEELSE